MVKAKQRTWKERLNSRKFLLSIVIAVVIIANELVGTPIDRNAYPWVSSSIAAFVLGESYVDGKAVKEFVQKLMTYYETENDEDNNSG